MREKAVFVSLRWLDGGINLISKNEKIIPTGAIKSGNGFVENVLPQILISVRKKNGFLVTQDVYSNFFMLHKKNVDIEVLKRIQRNFENTSIFVEDGKICNVNSILASV